MVNHNDLVIASISHFPKSLATPMVLLVGIRANNQVLEDKVSSIMLAGRL